MTRKKRSKGAPSSSISSKLVQNLTKTLLQYVSGKRYEPLSSDDLIRELSLPTIHHALLKEILATLVGSGQLVEKKGKFSTPQAEARLARGTISVHHKGFGFVKVGSGPDVFIPKPFIGDAVDGDTVEIEVSPNVSAKGPEGSIVAILKRSRTHLAGTVIELRGTFYVAHSPLLGKDKPIHVKKRDSDLKVGDRILCKVLDWGGNETVQAELSRHLGHISDPSIDVDAAIEEFNLPDGFSKEAIGEAKAYGSRVSPQEAAKRYDWTQEETVTIDPDTAKDYDDAISLRKVEGDHYLLGVHIADVAHYVKPDSHLDREAKVRCNSTYFPGRCVPMLPEELSNELCSLKEGVKRLSMSVIAEFDRTGTLIDYQVVRTVIKSQKRFTYKEAFDVLQKKKKSAHLPLLELMVELCHLFKKKRFERGSIEFAMSDDVVMVNAKGEPERIERVEYDITHQMIEEFMLKANELVALKLANEGKTLIYRIHEEPSPESFEDFYHFARSLGFSLPAKPTHLDIQRLFQEAKDSPLLPQLSVSFIRSMRVAQYSPENVGHYGLALEHYCHFTSPIRRYTDLIIQRLLMNELEPSANLEAVAMACSEKERLSFKAESSVVLLKKLRLAETHFKADPTQIYPAVITKVKPFALFFEVAAFDLEATFHISELGNDYFEYNPRKMIFRGSRTGKRFAAGDSIYVRLDRIDFILQESQWTLVPPPSIKPAIA